MRPSLIIPLLAVAAGHAWAYDSSAVAGGGVTFNYLDYASQKFSAGYFDSSWTKSERYEIDCMMQFQQWYNPQARVLPCGGVYGYYEDRHWDPTAIESGSMYSWGIGLQGGANIFLLPQSDRFNMSLVPYLRGGLGYMSASFYNVPYYGYPGYAPSLLNFNSDSSRLELAAGVDLRVAIANRLELIVGGGVDYYTAASIYITSGSGGTSGAVVGNSYAFNGTDAWLKLGIGVHF